MPETDVEISLRHQNLSLETQVNEHAHPSQEARILNYLRQGFSITQQGAIKLFKCYRLSSRVNRLKSQGYAIKSVLVYDPNGSRYARYFLEAIR